MPCMAAFDVVLSVRAAVVVAPIRAILMVLCPAVIRTRAAAFTGAPVIAIAVTMSLAALAVTHVPVVVDRDAGTPVIMSIVIASVVRMTPVARVMNVQVTV